MDMNEEEVEGQIKTVIETISDSFDRGLFAKSREELEDYYHFRWMYNRSLRSNTYEFWDLLSLYGRQCRRWEEHHHGCICVVERVRDQYLLPKIDEFLALVRARIQDELRETTT
jgi:hypothetical protein